MQIRNSLSFLLAVFISISVYGFSGDPGYNIRVDVKNFDKDTLLLGYYLGDKQYLRDTTTVDKKGRFLFTSENALEPGLYMIVFPPENNFFELIINETEQDIVVDVDFLDLKNSIKVKGSKDHLLFESYKDFLSDKRVIAQSLRDSIGKFSRDDPNYISINLELDNLDLLVKEYQDNLINNNPGTVTRNIVRASQQINIPEFEGDEETVRNLQFQYYRKHYWDAVDLGDPLLLRTPLLFGKVDNFITRLTPQIPDSINSALSIVLDKMYPAKETFMFYLVYYLNHYAKSQYVGMDGVYVHLVNTYYKTEKADWVDSTQLASIIENADKLEPLLIGKTAPDIRVYKQDGEPISLHEVQAEYTLLLFWAQDCGHCKKSFPGIIDFYKNYKSKGIEIFAVCSKLMDEELGCWEYLKDKEGADWINTSDKYMRSGFKVKYNIISTPQLYLLDKDKKIVTKKVPAEKLPEILDIILEQDAQSTESK